MTDDRDVILVTVDSLRADHCGFMGYDRDTTPTLDQLAREGLSFEQAIAPAGSTNASMPALLTGEYPVDPGELSEPLDRDEWLREHMRARETLVDRLSRRGYETAAFTANPWTSRHFGFDQGFDHFEDFIDDSTGESNQDFDTSLLDQLRGWIRNQDMFTSWEAFYDDVRAWLATADSPYFLWVFLVDVHVPYLPPAAYRSRRRSLTYLANLALFAGRLSPGSLLDDVLFDAYDDVIRYTDVFLERLLSDLGDQRPLIVVHGDHGEELGEYGTYGHGAHMYDETVHVPLVVANGPSGTVRDPFSLRSLPDLVGSLAAGDDVGSPSVPYVRCRNYDPTFAVRGRSWKYVRSEDEESLYRIVDGHERPLDDDRLRAVGRELVDRWRESEREKARVRRAARRLGDDAAL